MENKVVFNNVTKKFKMYSRTSDKFKDLFRIKEKGQFHYALKNVSFKVTEGEIVGIVGLNGAGKSTLSNLISGVTIPSSGEAKVRGNAALIAISSGLNTKLTGIENIELKGLMLGLTKKKIKEITPSVIEFADIGKFMDQPVKTYSSGMKARLGFAISVNIDPDILVIDEALSVGDQTFTNRCLKKMNEFKENGKTIFFISHSLAQVKSFCTKALWLHNGQVREYGEANQVVDNYSTFLKNYNSLSPEKKQELLAKPNEKNSDIVDPASIIKMSRAKPKKKRDFYLIKRLSLAGFLLLTFLLTAYLNITKPDVSLANVASVFAGKKAVHPRNTSTAVKNKHDRKKVVESKVEKPKEINVAIITKDLVNLRNKSNLNSHIIDQGTLGQSYKEIDKKIDPNDPDVNWIQIELSNGRQAWVSSSLVKEVSYTYPSQIVHTPGLERVLSMRQLPPTFVGLNKLFNKSFSSIKDASSNQIIDQNMKNGVSSFKIQSAELSGKGDLLTKIKLTDIKANLDTFTNQLGDPLYFSEHDAIYVYFINDFNISVSVNFVQQKVRSIEISKII